MFCIHSSLFRRVWQIKQNIFQLTLLKWATHSCTLENLNMLNSFCNINAFSQLLCFAINAWTRSSHFSASEMLNKFHLVFVAARGSWTSDFMDSVTTITYILVILITTSMLSYVHDIFWKKINHTSLNMIFNSLETDNALLCSWRYEHTI